MVIQQKANQSSLFFKNALDYFTSQREVKNIVKFNTFTAEGFSETRPFMHLSKYAFQSITPEILKPGGSIFSECLKFNVDSKNGIKMQQNIFGFSDNCI